MKNSSAPAPLKSLTVARSVNRMRLRLPMPAVRTARLQVALLLVAALLVAALPSTTAADGAENEAPTPADAPLDADAAKRCQEAWAKHTGAAVEMSNSIGMKLALIPPGQFTMGEGDDAVPVTLTRPFRLGVHEVTQAQFKAVMGAEPWRGKPRTAEAPMSAASYVSWDDATEFCRKLTEREREAGQLAADEAYRLPTEAEWEFACRGGTTTSHSFGDDSKRLGDYGWHIANTQKAGEPHPHAVGFKKPNAWGLCDVHGNVWEWCRDVYRSKRTGGRDPELKSGGPYRVYRGGGWNSSAADCRSAIRSWDRPQHRQFHLGFRLALGPAGGLP